MKLFLTILFYCLECTSYGQPQIKAFGDSFTWGNGTSAPNFYRYPEVLQSLLNYPVNNLGASGETSREILSRVLMETPSERACPHIFWAGRNDTDSAMATRCIDSMIQFIGHDRYLVLQELNQLDWKFGSQEWQIYEDINNRLKSKYGYHYLAIRDSMSAYISGNKVYDSTAQHDRCANQYLMWDLKHPNSNGYYFIAQKIAERSAVLFGTLAIRLDPAMRRIRIASGYFVYEIFCSNGQLIENFTTRTTRDKELIDKYPAGKYYIIRNGELIKYTR